MLFVLFSCPSWKCLNMEKLRDRFYLQCTEGSSKEWQKDLEKIKYGLSTSPSYFNQLWKNHLKVTLNTHLTSSYYNNSNVKYYRVRGTSLTCGRFLLELKSVIILSHTECNCQQMFQFLYQIFFGNMWILLDRPRLSKKHASSWHDYLEWTLLHDSFLLTKVKAFEHSPRPPGSLDYNSSNGIERRLDELRDDTSSLCRSP